MSASERFCRALAARGVRFLFGIPGGGPGLHLIDAAERAGIRFILARTETAAVIMASVTAELSGTVGVALTGRGPGFSSAINGMAHAQLDRCPVLVFSDGLSDEAAGWVSHQSFDQAALAAPVSKAQFRVGADSAVDADALIGVAMEHPAGVVHLELVPGDELPQLAPAAPAKPKEQLERVASLVEQSKRPVIIAGLEARIESKALRALVETLGCPVFTTYKARGAVDTQDPRCIGLYTGGTAEQSCIEAADLIIAVGADPVEFIPQPWKYSAPLIEVASRCWEMPYVKPAVAVTGSLSDSLNHLAMAGSSSDWTAAELAHYRQSMEQRLDPGPGLTVRSVVETAQQAVPRPHRLTVDAGAHMISAMAYSQAREPFDVLISNGLATMAYSLPAAIASSLQVPERPVIAITGDGGLLMCLGELETAARLGCNIIVIVLNDGSLSLIDIKQQKLGLPAAGVRWQKTDFATMARAVGWASYSVSSATELEKCLRQQATTDPCCIQVDLDSAVYGTQLDALRS